MRRIQSKARVYRCVFMSHCGLSPACGLCTAPREQAAPANPSKRVHRLGSANSSSRGVGLVFVAAIRASPGFRVEACGTRGGCGVQTPPARNAALRGLAVSLQRRAFARAAAACGASCVQVAVNDCPLTVFLSASVRWWRAQQRGECDEAKGVLGLRVHCGSVG